MKKDAQPAMVCSPDDLVVWKDFPKGLRVLLLEHDAPSAAEIKMKLEAMDYIVSLFCKEEDALEAISNKAESFHVAIIEVTTGSSTCSFKFLEMARDLPTIVISNVECLSTMMKCIALGAAEFLQKPISEDKLRNIWQHVVHKAFNAGGSVLCQSLKPVKETVVSMLQLQSGTQQLRISIPSKEEDKDEEQEHRDTVANDKFPAPSTPQLGQGGRLLDDGDCHEQRACSTKHESIDNVNDSCQMRNSACSESKSADITSNNLIDSVTIKQVSPSGNGEAAAEEEVDSADGPKIDERHAATEDSMHSQSHSQENVASTAEDPKMKTSFPCSNSYSHANRGNRKKGKVDWTSDLHRRFVQAVEQLGVDHAFPSKILELMKVEGLTRHNVASHLQKYRMHRRHILPKDDDRRWQQHRDALPKTYMQKPLVAYHSNYFLPPSPVYPVWGHPPHHPSSFQMWGHANYTPMHPSPENWLWNSYPGIHADAWGCPVMPPYGQCPIPSQSLSVSCGVDVIANRASKDSSDHLAERVIDEAMKEAMSKPWLPLPLGLKPPSTDSVLAELHRQGIRTVPPRRSPSRLR